MPLHRDLTGLAGMQPAVYPEDIVPGTQGLMHLAETFLDKPTRYAASYLSNPNLTMPYSETPETWGGVAELAGVPKTPIDITISKGPIGRTVAENVPLSTLVGEGVGMLAPDPTGPLGKGLGLAMFAGGAARGFSKAPRKFSGMWDKKPRFEISDRASKIIPSNELEGLIKRGEETKLGKIFDHEDLYYNYPQLKDMNVKMDRSKKPGTAHYDDETNSIVFGPGSISRSNLLHEIQHPIQNLEKFARGGSPSQFVNNPPVRDIYGADKFREYLGTDFANELAEAQKSWDTDKINKLAKENPQEYNRINGVFNTLGVDNFDDAYSVLSGKVYGTPHEQYMNLAGEAESRHTAATAGLTEAERMSTMPLESTGLKLTDLITDMTPQEKKNLMLLLGAGTASAGLYGLTEGKY